MEKETFEDYLQRLKDRRTEDDYKYTDEDFIQYEEYIRDCCKGGMSVYKCLELMYFAEKDMDDQLFNREPRETPEEYFLDNIKNMLQFNNDALAIRFMEKYYHAKKDQEQHDLLPGFIKQFDPKEGEINGEEWTAVHFLKWLELNKFKIVK
jgi:hypothetical protein